MEIRIKTNHNFFGSFFSVNIPVGLASTTQIFGPSVHFTLIKLRNLKFLFQLYSQCSILDGKAGTITQNFILLLVPMLDNPFLSFSDQ